MAAMRKPLALLTVAAALAVAAPAQAVAPASAPGATVSGLIVPQGSIRGVKVGMPYAQVLARLGRPGSNRLTTHPILGKTRTLAYGLVTVTIDGRAGTSLVTSVSTTSRSDKTSSGLGVGSTEAQLRAGLKGLRCEKLSGYQTCWVGRLKAGNLVTDFSMSIRGKVKRVKRVSLSLFLD